MYEFLTDPFNIAVGLLMAYLFFCEFRECWRALHSGGQPDVRFLTHNMIAIGALCMAICYRWD